MPKLATNGNVILKKEEINIKDVLNKSVSDVIVGLEVAMSLLGYKEKYICRFVSYFNDKKPKKIKYNITHSHKTPPLRVPLYEFEITIKKNTYLFILSINDGEIDYSCSFLAHVYDKNIGSTFNNMAISIKEADIKSITSEKDLINKLNKIMEGL